MQKGGAKTAASIAASIGGGEKKKLVIWPEWSDADVNAEKWEAPNKAGGNRREEKGKSPTVQHLFEDPDGKLELPPSVKADHWERISGVLTEGKVPVIVDQDDGLHSFDLMLPNEHVHESELMRWITSQISTLWHQSEYKQPPEGAGLPPGEEEQTHSWRPWEHIYAINRVTRGPHIPVYNPYGKYAVKLYWMGCWRKVLVDDRLPFDENDTLLLPCTSLEHELWPMLLTKALLKVASIDYNGGSSCTEFGDFSVIHCLTGWLPETIPLHTFYMKTKRIVDGFACPKCDLELEDSKCKCLEYSPILNSEYDGEEIRYSGYGHLNEIWNLLKTTLPEFKLPEPKPEVPQDGQEANGEVVNGSEATKEEKEKENKEKASSADKSESKPGKDGKDKKEEKGKDKGKEDKKGKDKGSEKDKERSKEKSMLDEQPIPEHPEIVVFACYSGPPKYPVRHSAMAEMANASERLRQHSLSHLYPHPVLITQTRSCTLEPPPPPEVVPAWKLIRPRKKKTTPSDEPQEVVEEKPIQCVQIKSPFLDYKVSPVPIPTDTCRPKSALERGGTRPNTANVVAIEETDENAPEPEPIPEPPKTPVEEPKEEPKESPKPRSTTPSRRKSANSKERLALEKRESKIDTKQSAEKAKEAAAPPPGSEAATPDAGGDPAATPLEEGGEQREEGQAPAAEEAAAPEKKEDIWMDFEDFCKCFKTLYIFHKPNTYPHNHKDQDMKGPTDDKGPNYLFVDNLKPTEIVVSFSALSRWNEPPPQKDDSKGNLRGGKDKDRDSKADALTAESSSVVEAALEPKPPEPVQPGLLMAEPYSWKSLVTGQPLLRLRTTACRAAVLSLPEGRHVLRFHMSAPLGYHVHLTSSVPFVFGDEEKVMAELTKESCRFRDNATQVVNSLGKCIQGFTDVEMFQKASEEYYNSHCPYREDKHMSQAHHFEVFKDAFYQMLRKALGDAALINPEMAFAWRAFMFDVTTKNILALQLLGNKPNKEPAQGEAQDANLEHWKNREITPEEHVAAIKVTKVWRGFWVRKIMAARTPGTEINQKAQDSLLKAWAAIEPNAEDLGLFLFRSMFKTDSELMPKYPFYKDEWNKISYTDHQGGFPDQPPNAWFVVFREIFMVSEEMLCVPKMYVPIPSCLLRVVNNDTGEEVPRVFQKVAPYVYKKNKRGYTFIAEARTTEQALQAGRWRMRLIGSLSPLPAPLRAEVNSSFHTRELRDYYVPNEKNIILRYSVKVSEEHLVSLQMTTSKSDVYVKLSVLDNEEEMISAVGKGHVVLPAFIFQKNPGDEDNKRSSSRASNKGKKQSESSMSNKAKRVGSATHDGRSSQRSRSSSRQSVGSLENMSEEEMRPHKYIIQAVVMRNSWPLSETSWAFVQMLRELERNELKVANKDPPPDPPKEKQQSAASGKGKDKGSKGKAGKDKDKGSRPPSQQFDHTKPHWTLRIVSDGTAAEEIEVKKDTERADEIRAMKKAWEDAEPGRAAKALQSRLQYLNTHMVKVQPSEEDELKDIPSEIETSRTTATDGGDTLPPLDGATSPGPIDPLDGEVVLTLDPPRPPTPKEVLQELDLTPFLRKTTDQPRLLDENEMAAKLAAKQAEIRKFKSYRAEVEARREEDRQARNMTKIKQLELCEQMQAALDLARDSINQPREAFRQRFLDAERKRQEELAAQEAALQAEAAKLAAPSPKGRKSAKGGKKTPSSGKKKK